MLFVIRFLYNVNYINYFLCHMYAIDPNEEDSNECFLCCYG